MLNEARLNLTRRKPNNLPDLIEMRRHITALRSRHSDHLRVTYLLNRLLVKIAYLTEVENHAQAEELRQAYARTMAEVEECIAKQPRKRGRPPTG